MGATVPLCTAAFPQTTEVAAQRWNHPDALGKTVFVVHDLSDPACFFDGPSSDRGIDSVLIIESDQGPETCPEPAPACFRPNHQPNDEWDTFVGQPTIHLINPMLYSVKQVRYLDVSDGSEEQDEQVVRARDVITHELGHVFGLDDYDIGQCIPGGVDSSRQTTTDSLMAYDAACESITPTARDQHDFRLSYVPEAPAIIAASSPGPLEAMVVWDVINVHVESGFVVERETPDGTWETVATREAQPLPILPPSQPPVTSDPISATFSAPPGLQTFRVVSETHAPLQPAEEDADFPASAVATIPVKAPPPGAPTGLMATGGDTTITLRWDPAEDIPDITGYEYYYGGGPWLRVANSHHETITHTLRGLTNGTEYVVLLRAVRGSVAGESALVIATPTAPPEVSVRAVTSSVEEGTPATFTIARTGSVADGLIVKVDEARTGNFFTEPARTLVVIPRDAASWDFKVATAPDEVDEPDGSVKVTLKSGLTYDIDSSADSATVVIIDDDGLPTASLSIDEGSIAGDGIVNGDEKEAGFAITGSSESGASVTVTVGGTQLSAVTAAGDGSWSLSVTGGASHVTEGTVTVSATASKSGFTDGMASATITVDTIPPSVTYTAPSSLTAGTAVTITPSGAADAYALKADSILPTGLTLDPADGVISGTPSAIGAELTVTIVVADTAGNSAEVTLSLPAVTGGSTPVTIARVASPVTEGTDADFTVMRTGSTASALTVNVSVSETGQMIDGMPPASVEIAAGAASALLSVPTVNDTVDESASVVTVGIAGSTASATVTVNDNDVGIARVASPVTEGQPAQFTVTRDSSAPSALTVSVSVSETGQMIDGTPPSSVVILAGAASVILSVPTVNDSVIEPNSVVTAIVDASSASASVTVRDDDGTTPTCMLSVEADPRAGGTVSGGGTVDCGDPAPPVGYEANACWTFTHWSGDRTSPMTSDRTVTAHFEKIQYTLTPAASPSDGGTVAGGGTVDCGEAAPSVSATANSCWTHTHWSGDRTSPMTSDRTVTAHFERLGPYTLTVAPSPAAAASTSTSQHPCGASVDVGDQAPSPTTCWEYDYASPASVTMDGNRSATAYYTHDGTTHTLSVVASPPEGGTVSGGGTVDCGDPAPSVSATANSCWTHTQWIGDRTSPMTSDRTVTADFDELGPYTLTVLANPPGRGTVSGGGTYPCGTMVFPGAHPAYGYCVLGTATVKVTMDADKTITFDFCRNVYTVSVSASGVGSVGGGGNALYLDNVTVTATETDDDWAFVRWEIVDVFRSRSEVIRATDARATFAQSIQVNGNKDVTAVFIYECDVIGCRRDEGDGGTSAPATRYLSASLESEVFTVDWEAVEGADRYRVQYRSDPESDWVELADAEPTDMVVTWTPPNLACGQTYSFQLEAHGDGSTYAAEWGTALTVDVATIACDSQPAFGSSAYAFSVAAGAEVGTVVGQVATDPAAGVTYAITDGNAAGAFAIGATNGEITVAGDLDGEATPSHTLTVRASDGRGGTATTAVSIAVVQ